MIIHIWPLDTRMFIWLVPFKWMQKKGFWWRWLSCSSSSIRIPKKAKTFFENPSYVIRFTQPFIHSWIASKLKPAEKKTDWLLSALSWDVVRLDLLFAKLWLALSWLPDNALFPITASSQATTYYLLDTTIILLRVPDGSTNQADSLIQNFMIINGRTLFFLYCYPWITAKNSENVKFSFWKWIVLIINVCTYQINLIF